MEKDLKEAIRLWTLAADQGDASAQYILGLCYKNGEGVEKDLKEAVRWFRLAAEKGNNNAKMGLAGIKKQYPSLC